MLEAGMVTELELPEIEKYMDGDIVLCERRLRKSSRSNPFTVQGACDLCGETDPRMNFAVYTMPNVRCNCCEGKHSIITKYCNRCTPLSPSQFYEAVNLAEDRAKDDLIKKYGKPYKDLLVDHAFSLIHDIK